MAKQKGIIKLVGKVGDLSFYKSQDGHLAREKGGVDGARIKSDPAFVRTRENGAEFGSAAAAGKAIRDAIRPLLMSAGDNRVTSRLTKVMTDIKNYDTLGARGARTVALGLGDPAAKALLKGFNFNAKAVLGAKLFKPYTLDPATGIINIVGLVPINDISFPSGATHFSMTSAWVKLDFNTGVANVQLSNTVNLLIDETVNAVNLTPAAVPVGPGFDLYLLQIAFYQEVNGTQYSLKNGAYNALAIIEVL